MSAARRDKPLGTSQEWLRHAESDLALGRLGAKDPDVLPEQICFHAQQAIEKGLKGLLVHIGQSFPLVHDLEQLLEILRDANVDLPAWADDLLDLTPYAVENRYPGAWDEVTVSDQDCSLVLAQKTLEWVKDQLST